MALRASFNSLLSKDQKISLNDFVIKAAAAACLKVPMTNSAWMNEFIRVFKSVNMSIAVQTDFGLMAPVIFNVDKKGLLQISKEVKDVASRARSNKLKIEELSGGTFTISNLGMFGTHEFSGIINPPAPCLLAISASELNVIYDDKATDKT